MLRYLYTWRADTDCTSGSIKVTGGASSSATSSTIVGLVDAVTGVCLVSGNRTGCGRGAMEAIRRCDAMPLHTRTISARVAAALEGVIVSDARPGELRNGQK